MIPREPFGPVQLLPTGMLGFLQLKSQGRTPAAVPDTLQCTLQMREWLFNTHREVIEGQHFLTMDGTQISGGFYGFFVTPGSTVLEVPANEYWYVHAYSVRAGVNSATFPAAYAAFIESSRGGTQDTFVLGELMKADGGLFRSSIRDFWLPPGAELGVYFGIATATDTETFTASALVTRLPI